MRSACATCCIPIRPGRDICWNPALGGGGLLDVGCYPVRALTELFGVGPEVADARAWRRGEIDRRLVGLERLAREKGSALGLAADVSPVLVDRVAAWARGLEARGLVMAPVTALIRRPEEMPR